MTAETDPGPKLTQDQLHKLRLDMQEAIYKAMTQWAKEIPGRCPGFAATVAFAGVSAVQVFLHPASPPGQPALTVLEARISSPRLGPAPPTPAR